MSRDKKPNRKKYFMVVTCPSCHKARQVTLQGSGKYAHQCRACYGKEQARHYAEARDGCRPGFERRACIACQAVLEVRTDSPAIRCKSCAMKEVANRPDVRAANAERNRGERSNFWNGGVSTENEKQRKEAAYREWRRAVFARDQYTCQSCGLIGGRLHADHIKPYALHPELRHDVANGRTLCETCHRQTDTWGYKANVKARTRKRPQIESG